MSTDNEIIEKIKFVLEDKVKPSVAMHGGFINFISYKDGHLKLEMAGSCSGCAMSQVTLKQGVESMMKHYVPEVMSIESQDDEKAQEKGYTPWA
jgi:Fe-S cluster biogenesis protein NfuA|tara:strand:+ start:1694 stop:1975 length:282 start_codon:yes stop_codon:yes gene_type:complete